ncbi:Craniofacial development protein 2 [Varanus komodoensis]|nr:Craniofacial development protein 2 [Varanus komodoensis]
MGGAWGGALRPSKHWRHPGRQWDEQPTTTAVVEYLMRPSLTQTLLPAAPSVEDRDQGNSGPCFGLLSRYNRQATSRPSSAFGWVFDFKVDLDRTAVQMGNTFDTKDSPLEALPTEHCPWERGHVDKLDGHQVYYCGQESLRRNGVAFIVSKRVGKAVLGYNLQTDRMISVRIQGKPFNITVVQVYAPTTGAEEAEVDRFYEGLQHLLELTPKNDVLIIMGDWNAKVGSQRITGITGKFGLGVQNEAGHRLVEFCQENTMVIANTLFQQPKRQLYTWTSPDGQHRNQIDYVLCSQSWRSSIQSVKTRAGADCGSDHELLVAKFRLKLKKVGKSTGPLRYDLNHIPDEYTEEMTNRFKELDLIDRVPEELWTEVHNIVQEAATKTILKKKKCKKAKWLSEEALQIAEERREVKVKGERERYNN